MNNLPVNIKTIYQYYASHPEGKWIMNWSNALDLHHFITTHDVKNVLDLGTGIGVTAAITALAFNEKGVKDYHIDSIEQSDKCIRLAKEIIPNELKGNITFHKANPVVWETADIPHIQLSTYDKLPEVKGGYDLIINDGPGPFLEENRLVDIPNGTIAKLLLEGKLKTDSWIIYDGRLSSLKVIERFFGNNFYLIPQRSKGDFNVLQRKDNKVECLDDRKLALEQQGYFKDATN